MSQDAATSAVRASWWSAGLILAAAFAAYHNSFHGPFVFDDASSIVTNPTIRSIPGSLSGPTNSVTAQGRPILNLSLALNHAIGGTSVEGYHVVNLIIHALAGLTLFGVVRRTLHVAVEVTRHSSSNLAGTPSVSLPRPLQHRTGLALAAAVLWTVHPLQTESVTYIIQRAESLVGLFYLLTLYAFARGVELQQCSPARESRGIPPLARRATGWFLFSWVACLLGMATKEVMATAPLMVLFFDRTFFAGTFAGALRRRPGFYAALAGTWLLLAWLVVQGGGNRGGSVGFGVGISPWEYWLTQFKAIAHYLWLSLWPHPLVFEYGGFLIRDGSEIAVPMLIVLALLGATIVALWRRSPLGFLGAWFFGILAPTSLAPGTTQMIVEHRMYLPLAAVAVALVLGLRILLARRASAAVAAAVILALVALTIRRNDDYRSDITLWADTVARRPANPLAHFMLGDAQERAGDLVPALASYQRTLALKPDFSIGHGRIGELLLKQGRRAEAIGHFTTAIGLQPDYADAHANLGSALLAENRTGEAIPHLERAVRLMPESVFARYHLGNALGAMGRIADALPHYEAAVKLQPDFAEAHYNLANTLAMSGRQREAVPHYEAALRARPGYAEAHHNLGSAFFELGDLGSAARHYEETLRLDPRFPNARANLERVRAKR